MSMRSRILVVDDHEVTRKLLREVLEKEGYWIDLAGSGEQAVQLFQKEKYSVILSDIRMKELSGIDTLREAKKNNPGSIVILMTGFGSMEGAVEAIQEGAFDYISKPFKINDLKIVIARAVKQWESLQGGGSSRGVGSTGSHKSLIGKSVKMVNVYKTLARAALSTSPVLVMGEHGTGKELVARAIYENSPHSSRNSRSPPSMRRFISVNCSTGLESLEFDKKNFFEEASGGTLFLDEVGKLAIPLQLKLLRIFQSHEFKLPVRLIASTHEDLECLVKQGVFREDLYYRLKVISIELPPLRERMEDLPDLVGHFVALYSEKSKKAVSHISDEGMSLLQSYLWPGNVRELENAVERAVAMANTAILFPEDFPEEIIRKKTVEEGLSISNAATTGSLEEIEKNHILRVLQTVSYNKSRASVVLGIDRATLYRKAQRYSIDLRGK